MSVVPHSFSSRPNMGNYTFAQNAKLVKMADLQGMPCVAKNSQNNPNGVTYGLRTP